ncbi:MAG: adenosylcobinamide-GDP ribazoletransferase [Rhodoferax sp.]|nr:adenosylcobinamide-GDP ribazoletransferase [Rhodoferax sp.]
MSHFLRHYLLAVQFFTRIPVTGRLAAWVGFSPAMLRASAAHFPGVGVVVGALVAGVTAVLLACLPHSPFAPLVAAVLGTVLSVMVTGAFHEDGLADVADGLGGSSDRERALVIMKDSRVGAFGALALVLALLSKVGLLALIGSVSPRWMVLGIFSAHVVSRTWPLLLIRLMPHVGDAAGSKSKPLADQISGASLLAAGMWCLMALALVFVGYGAIDSGVMRVPALFPVSPLLVALFASSLGFAYMGRLLWRRLQGFTGDGLGATQQLCELAFYLGLALAL